MKRVIDLYNNGEVKVEYDGYRATVKLFGFVIRINKPYSTIVDRTVDVSEMTIDSAVIEMSTNKTVQLGTQELNYINKVINDIIQVLNRNESLKELQIPTPYFSCVNSKVVMGDNIPAVVNNSRVVEAKKVKREKKSISYRDIKRGTVYADSNGTRWMYLGEGFLYKNGIMRNRCDGWYGNIAKNIYLNMSLLNESMCSSNGIYKASSNKLLVSSGDCMVVDIDTYITKKRFVKEIGDFGMEINGIIITLASGSTIRYDIVLNNTDNKYTKEVDEKYSAIR